MVEFVKFLYNSLICNPAIELFCEHNIMICILCIYYIGDVTWFFMKQHYTRENIKPVNKITDLTQWT